MNLTRRTLLLSPLALLYKPSWGALSFPLPQGHFVKAKMPMYPVFPRPDSETQAHARHRWAHPDFRYEIPIGVQGGAWPFKYEILSGPSGATIGQYYGDPDYGVVKWTPAVGDSGTKTFTVRVTDQELNTLDFTWTVTIDPTQFIFVDASAASTGTGTISSPLKTFADWYKGDVNDATYHNKIIVFRAGTYSAVGDTNYNGNVRVSSATKTPSLIGYPGESPIFDCSSAKFFWPDAMADIFIANITFQNARADVANSHFFWITNTSQRVTVHKNRFDSLGNGTSGTDNPSGIFISGTGGDKYNILIKQNTFENFTNNGPNGSFMDLYRTFYVTIEENTCVNSNPQYGIWAKVTKAFVTIRANSLENMTGGGIVVHYGDAAPGQPHDHEICWNKVLSGNASDGAYTLLFVGDSLSSINANHYNSFIYRNTFIGGSAWVRFKGIENFETDGNVVVNNFNSRWNTDIMDSLIANVVGSPKDGITDALGHLSGNFRKNYLGLIGHEISEHFVATPKSPIINLQ